MKLLTRQMLADGVADRWERQYEGSTLRFDWSGTLAALRALPKPVNPGEVDQIIGNGSWTNLTCNDCNKCGFNEVVRVGQEPGYESYTAHLCKECATKVLGLFGG